MNIQHYEEMHRLFTDFDSVLNSTKDINEKTVACAALLMLQVGMLGDLKEELNNEDLEAKIEIIMDAITKTGEKIIKLHSKE